MTDIVLCTLNARYSHASLGLRYLAANMGPLRERTRLVEFVIDQRPLDMAEQLLANHPRVIGFGVYIWNVEQTTRLVATIKQVAPDVIVVLGGPEVSYEWEQQAIFRLADYLITGWGDVSLAELCEQLMRGEKPAGKVIAGKMAPLAMITMPYDEYTDEDIAHRVLYVEASRGCPFKCEFCLSSLDKTAWPFELEPFLAAMGKMYERGARQFKFVDRTFNLNIATSARILEFFLDRLDEKLFLHFEVIPDHLPERLKELILKFPPGSLQFEIGIQTFNPETQRFISRKQNDEKTETNLRWLRTQTHAHIHADLIVGLPGESLQSFAAGFDRLVGMDPHEIQVGILKRLRGTPIIRHTDGFWMRYNTYPPYDILANDQITFLEMQRMTRFARYWDLVANSGRFKHSKATLLGQQPFERFMNFSEWLFERTGQTHRIALEKLYQRVHQWLLEEGDVSTTVAAETVGHDYSESGLKGYPEFLSRGQPTSTRESSPGAIRSSARRQGRHVA